MFKGHKVKCIIINITEIINYLIRFNVDWFTLTVT